MQDDYLNDRRVVGVSPQIKVPARLVDWLRRSSYAEIGTAAEDLDTAASAGDREEHPDWFRAPAQRLRELYSLLDSIGWAATTPPSPVPIDLRQDGWALTRALNGALEFADEEVQDRSQQAGAQVCACDCERVSELYDFMAGVRARIDTLAVEEATEPIADLVA